MVRKILVVTVGEQKTPLFEGFKRVKDIRKELKKPTILGHLSKLIKNNLIKIDPKSRRYSITDTGIIFLDILEVAG